MNTKPIETHRKPPQSRELVALLITVLLAVINSGAGFAAAGSRASSLAPFSRPPFQCSQATSRW